MIIGLYKDEYGIAANYREFPCVEINLDNMTSGTEYEIEKDFEFTLKGKTFRIRHVYIRNAGISKVQNISENSNDWIMQKPFWTWVDATSQRQWMGENFTAHSFSAKPNDWDRALYYKYYTRSANSKWIQMASVASTTFNPATTYYTCNGEQYEAQKIYYAKGKYAASFIIGQMLGSSSSPYIEGGLMQGYCCGISLGGTSTGRYRVFAFKDPDEEYNGYDSVSRIDLLPFQDNSLNHWTNVSTPVQNITLPFTWQMAHIIYQNKEYIGWGPIRWGGYESYPEGPYLANFTFVPIEFFEDAIDPGGSPSYSVGVGAGNDGSAGMGTGLPEGDPMVPTGLHGGLSLIAASGDKGIHQYIIDSTNAAKFNSVLWNTENSLWDKFANAKYNPMAGILGFFMIPSELLPDTLVSEQYVQIAGKICDGDDLEPAVNAYAVNPTVNITKPVVYDLTEPDYVFSLTLGSGRLPYKSFADFARTKVTLHVPFCGSVQLDPDQCIGGRVEVYYYCDTMTGNVCAQVLTVDMTGRNHVACILTGNCAYTQPLSGSDTNATATLMSSLTSFVGSTIVSAATGNPVPAVTSAISGAANIVQAKNATLTSGSMTGNAGWLGFRSFKLDVSWGQYLDTDGCYVDVNGRPSCDDSKIVNDFSGYAEMMINTDNIAGATDEEKERLRIAFRNGVILTYPSE